MQGEGTYEYKKTGDFYSGTWVDNKKWGQGRYFFGKDESMFVGTWENGQITTGQWELKNAAVYTGNFKLGRPVGEGTFVFESGLQQTGSYVEEKVSWRAVNLYIFNVVIPHCIVLYLILSYFMLLGNLIMTYTICS